VTDNQLAATLLDIERVASQLVGQSVPRPNGTLAGHSAALPFEKVVHLELSKVFGKRAFRQFELLNHLLASNKSIVTAEGRRSLLGTRSLQKLISRGKEAMSDWTIEQQFEEKQNDTAESIILPGLKTTLVGVSPIVLIDVKSKAVEKRGQPPNIISADKVANICKSVIEDNDASAFFIVYIAVGWEERLAELVCSKTNVVQLNRISPESLYINWVAAQQIQFDPFDVDQSYRGNVVSWAKAYLVTYCEQLEKRVDKEIKKIAEYRAVYSTTT